MVEQDLQAVLAGWARKDDVRVAVASAVSAIARAGTRLAALVADGPRGAGADHHAIVGANLGGDAQKALDVIAHEMVLEEVRFSGIAMLGSEEADAADTIDPDGLVAVATDPLDGSSNIDTNVSIGTIFSVLPMKPGADPFLQPGRAQLAAGYVIYGPHTDLVLTLGEGTLIFTLQRSTGRWLRTADPLSIPPETTEFAINASNYRHWEGGYRRWFDDCIAGTDGPREKDFNIRWIASLVAEATRILARGGVFLYPGDMRRGYSGGRLRLVYEANPIAMVVEQAGGRATDGVNAILDIVPTDLHQRTPLVFGAANEVARIDGYVAHPDSAEQSPLFGYRGLFRA